jgi:hypothetical protein
LAKTLGKPEIYEGANQAAQSAYNGARNAGQSHDQARQASYEAYHGYSKQGRGNARFPFAMGMEEAMGTGGKTMPLNAGLGGSMSALGNK